MSTHNIPIFIIKKETHLKLSYGIFPRDSKNQFEIALVNEPSVFEPLKVYCICNFTCENVFFFSSHFLLIFLASTHLFRTILSVNIVYT